MIRPVLNPATQTVYRLVTDQANWRITKSLLKDGARVLRHLRGSIGDQPLDLAAIDSLLRGNLDLPSVVGDPVEYFSQTVITDFDRTHDLLLAVAWEAHQRMRDGVPGFRASSPLLKQEARRTVANAEAACRDMAMAWKESGLETSELPKWLAAALEG